MAAALEAVAMSVAQMDVPAFLYTHIFLNAQILNSHEQAFQIASNAASRIPLSQQYFKQATGKATPQSCPEGRWLVDQIAQQQDRKLLTLHVKQLTMYVNIPGIICSLKSVANGGHG